MVDENARIKHSTVPIISISQIKRSNVSTIDCLTCQIGVNSMEKKLHKKQNKKKLKIKR